jgi:MFS family permease
MTLIQIGLVTTVISGVLLAFVVPESLPSKQSAHIQNLYEKAIGPKAVQAAASSKRSQENVAWHSHVVRSLQFFKPDGHNTNLIILASISFLQTLALKGTMSVLILYTIKVFNWREREDGLLFFLGSLVRLITLLVLSPILVHSFHKWNNKKREALTVGPQRHNESNNKDLFDTPSSSSTNIDITNNNNTIIDHQDLISVGVDDLNVASSIEHLGEAALNLSDDEESFQERRRRKSNADTLISTTRPNYSSTLSAAPRKHSVGSDSRTSQQEEQQKKAEKARDDMKLDTWIVRLGYVVSSTTYVGYGLATEPWMFYLWSSLHAISIIAVPSLRSLITSQVEPSQFGAVLGAVQVLDSMSGILSPIMISWVYALTVGTMPEFVWYTCAALTGICAVLSFMIRQRHYGRRASNA